jgi:hypothetical protein
MAVKEKILDAASTDGNCEGMTFVEVYIRYMKGGTIRMKVKNTSD